MRLMKKYSSTISNRNQGKLYLIYSSPSVLNLEFSTRPLISRLILRGGLCQSRKVYMLAGVAIHQAGQVQ